MVAAAHLKPLEKKDHIHDKFVQPWNIIASKQSFETSNDTSNTKLKVNDPRTTNTWKNATKRLYGLLLG